MVVTHIKNAHRCVLFLKSAAKVCIFFEYTKLLCKKPHIRASEASDYYISNEKRGNKFTQMRHILCND